MGRHLHRQSVRQSDEHATADPNIFENYLMREFRDDTTVTRRIVQELVDNKGRKLAFTEKCDIVFDRKSGAITTTAADARKCVAAARAYQRAYLERMRKIGGTGVHGTRSRYTKGCRCAECRRANAEYDVELRARKKPL